MNSLDLKPYLKSLHSAVIRRAPPWPVSAKKFMVDNSTELLGWYDGPDEDGNARIYVNLKDPDHQKIEELLRTVSEELLHHCENNLPDGAAKARAVSLLGYSRFRAAIAERVLGALLKK